jgi:hypothetical protein
LIKLAAAFVHGARGNPAGVAKNLQGARERLAHAGNAGERLGVDVAALLGAVDGRLAAQIDVADPPIQIPHGGQGGDPGRGRVGSPGRRRGAAAKR